MNKVLLTKVTITVDFYRPLSTLVIPNGLRSLDSNRLLSCKNCRIKKKKIVFVIIVIEEIRSVIDTPH